MEDFSLIIFIYAQLKMAAGDAKDADFYGVLGLEKECTAQELRKAYKRLALRWHPDRCSGSTRSVEEAKKKFQDIQEAYSVLSDSNKRFLYDVGLYQKDDDDEHMQDMGDFLSEMAAMVSQTKPTENGEESLEQLQELFDEMFQDDNSLSNAPPFNFNPSSGPSSFYSSSFNGYGDNSNPPDYANSASSAVDAQFQNFRQGVS
uniref:J domain-containing protein n=1 Tax=Kalanchoe fedtschenkoi TaxID=63787 RepID=A0A7N0UAL7_KALFE